MALTAVNVLALTLSAAGFGTGAYTTPAFTPGAGKRLVVRLMAMSNQDDALAGTDLTITDSMGPLTWTPIVGSSAADSIGWGYAGRAWISSDTTGAGSMTLSVDAGTFDVYRYAVIVEAVDGEDASPIGATAVGNDANGNDAASITLSGAPAATSIVFALVIRAESGTATGVTHGTGWTEDGQALDDLWLAFQTQRRTGSTSATVGWDDLSEAGGAPVGALMLAFEVMEQSGPGPTIDTQPQSQTKLPGQTATFTVSATSTGGTLHYDWEVDTGGGFTNVGTDSSSFTTGTLVLGDNGDIYRCNVSDDNGTRASSSATLTVQIPTVTYGAAGAIAYSASGGTSVAPAYPTGITADSQLVLLVGQKPATANGGTVTTPSGWSPLGSSLAQGGYSTTLGVDTGNTNLLAYTKDTVSGSESGTLTVTVGDNGVCWAVIVRLAANAAGLTWAFAAAQGSDSSAGSVSIVFATDPGVDAGDLVIGAMCIPTDVTTPAQFSGESITQTGVTFGTVVEIDEPDSTTGNDIGGLLCYAPVTAGPSSAAPTLTATAGGTTTNVRGPGLLLRARVSLASGDVYLPPQFPDLPNYGDLVSLDRSPFDLSWLVNPAAFAPSSQQDLAGNAAALASAAAALELLKGLAAAASGSGSVTASLDKAVALAVAAAAAAGATGQIALTVPLAGVAAGLGSGSGALGLSKPLAGSATGAGAATGDLSTSSGVTLGGSAAAQAGASGALSLSIALLGAALGQSAASAAMSHGVPLAASAAGVAEASGALSSSSGLLAAAVAVADASGQLALSIALQGAALASATATGTFNTAVNLGGAAAAAAGASGTLFITVPLNAQAQAIATAGGGLVLTVLLGGQAQGQASAGAAFAEQVLLTGAAGGVATVTGQLAMFGLPATTEKTWRVRMPRRNWVARGRFGAGAMRTMQ